MSNRVVLVRYSSSSIIWCFVLLVLTTIVVQGFGQYNSVPVLIFDILFFLKIRDWRFTTMITIFMLFIGMISIFNGVSYLSILADLLDMYFIASSVYMCKFFSPIPNTLSKIFSWFLIVLCASSVVATFFPSFYSYSDTDFRFDGIFTSSGNTSSHIFLMFEILAWEILKNTREMSLLNKVLLLIFVVFFGYYCLVSKTRTLLFAFPYWLYQIYLYFPTKILIVFIIPIIYKLSSTLWLFLSDNMRIGADASFNTRSLIYIELINGVFDNYIVIPHGSHAAWSHIREFTGNDEFSPHNDFLRYLYDWGIIFLIIVFYSFKRFCSSFKFDINLILIFTAFSSGALHNIMFLPIIWLPMIFIFLIYTSRQKTI